MAIFSFSYHFNLHIFCQIISKMSIALILPILMVLVSALFYVWLNHKLDYFRKRGIPFLKPRWLMGETVEVLFHRYSPHEFAVKLYKSFPNEG